MSGEAKARGKGKKGGYRGKKGSHTEEEEISNGIGNGHGEKIYLLVSFVCLFVRIWRSELELASEKNQQWT